MGEPILILGEGRIAKAIFYYFKKFGLAKRIKFFSSEKDLKDVSLIVSCLPGEEGYLGLDLALKFKKNLLDVSDLDPPFYLKRKKEIEKKGVFVVPGCGFSPGLVNFIIGRELFGNPQIDTVIVKAGSLSKEKFFFPFLWCFEDLVQEHRLSSFQIISGKKIKLAPFSGYQEENFFGIPAESYFSVSGFENLLNKRKFLDFHFRVVRPRGFMNFFKYLENYGFLNKKNFLNTKKILEEIKKDNYTFSTIEFKEGKSKTIFWRIFSFSKKRELLNSMQKITALVPVCLYKIFSIKKEFLKGLIFMEDLAKEKFIFENLLKEMRNKGIFLRKEEVLC